MSTFKVLFYLKRNAIRKDGKMPIVARVTIDGITAQFNTKLAIQPNNWSVKMGKVIGHPSDNKQHNAQLEQIKASINGQSVRLRLLEPVTQLGAGIKIIIN